MSRINFRQVRDRFTHIDADFVRARCAIEGDSELVVRLYPWWEHPAYVDARSRNRTWGFTDASSRGKKDVTVLSVRTIAFKLSIRSNVIDWDFPDRHPLLWKYEDNAEICLNSDVSIPALIDAVLERKLPYVTRAVLYEHIDPLPRHPAPYSLGYLPASLFRVVSEVLTSMGVRFYAAPRALEERDLPALLVLDGDDYILADDFILDVPNFEHEDSWFDGGTPPTGGA